MWRCSYEALPVAGGASAFGGTMELTDAEAQEREDEAYERWVGLVEACDAASEPDPA